MQWTYIDLNNLTLEQLRAAVAIAIAIGTRYCFLGYRVLKLVIAIMGFVLVGSLVGSLAGFLSKGNLWIVAIAGAIGGIAGVGAFRALYKVGVFILALGGGGVLGAALFANQPESYATSGILSVAVFTGLCGLIFERSIMSLATAAIGAWIVVHGLTFFLLAATSLDGVIYYSIDPSMRWKIVGTWAGLALLGAWAQFATHKEDKAS